MPAGVILDRRGRPVADVDPQLRARGLDRVSRLLELAGGSKIVGMAEVNPPLYEDVDLAYSGDELGLPWRDAVTEGVVGRADLAVSQRAAGANMSVDVAGGAAWIKGDDQNYQPTYRVRSDSTVNLAVAAADATNPRVDRVIAEVLDATFSGTQRLWRLRVLTGTPTAGATLANATGAALIPNSAILLANALVPAAATTVVAANIDTGLYSANTGNVVRQKASVGGVLGAGYFGGQANLETTRPRLTAAEFLALTTPYVGMEVEVYFGTGNYAWALRYDPGIAANAAYPWIVVGASFVASYVATNEWRTVAGWGDTATAHSLVVPLAGVYFADFGAEHVHQGIGTGVVQATQQRIFSTAQAASFGGWARFEPMDVAVGNTLSATVSSATPSFAVARSDTLKVQYQQSTGFTSALLFQNRWLRLWPVAVGQA